MSFHFFNAYIIRPHGWDTMMTDDPFPMCPAATSVVGPDRGVQKATVIDLWSTSIWCVLIFIQ